MSGNMKKNNVKNTPPPMRQTASMPRGTLYNLQNTQPTLQSAFIGECSTYHNQKSGQHPALTPGTPSPNLQNIQPVQQSAFIAEFPSYNNQNIQSGQHAALMPGNMSSNVQNTQPAHQSAFIAEFPSYNNQNIQSGQHAALVPGNMSLHMQNTQSGPQPVFMTGFPRGFGQQSGFMPGFSSANSNVQVSQPFTMGQAMMQPDQTMMFMNCLMNSMVNAYGSFGGSTGSQMAVNQQSSSLENQDISFDNIVESYKMNQSSDSSFEEKSLSASIPSTDDSSSIDKDQHSNEDVIDDKTTASSRTRPFVKSGTPIKRRKFHGLEYEEVDPKLTVKDIEKAYIEKTVTTVIPKKTDKNYEMYNVVRRLKRNHCIIPHYFRCEVCERIVYAHTVVNHAALTRHFAKCNGPVHIERNTLQQLIEKVLSIGAEKGEFPLAKIFFPSTITDQNIDQVLVKVQEETEK